MISSVGPLEVPGRSKKADVPGDFDLQVVVSVLAGVEQREQSVALPPGQKVLADQQGPMPSQPQTWHQSSGAATRQANAAGSGSNCGPCHHESKIIQAAERPGYDAPLRSTHSTARSHVVLN